MPFSEVKVERVRVTRYRSTFDMTTLLESARTELATDKTELFKILLLASMIRLRRHEIDLLPWSAFRWMKESSGFRRLSTFARSLMSRKARSQLIRSCSRDSEPSTPTTGASL